MTTATATAGAAKAVETRAASAQPRPAWRPGVARWARRLAVIGLLAALAAGAWGFVWVVGRFPPLP
jgi:hypothetical protein